MIKFTNFAAAPTDLIDKQINAASRVIRSGWYVLGPELSSFENAWANYCSSQHAVGVGNGMDAIEIGLRALGIGNGDEVITTSMTAFATVLAVIRAGATPVLADIDPHTALLCPKSVARCISPRTKAILLVHLYGQIANMDDWSSFAEQHGVMLVEDCAQAHGATWNGKCAGTWGKFGAYSFYPTKNLGAIGDGGALVSDDEALATSARAIRNYGQSQRYHHPQIGLNSRLDEIQAAFLGVQLDHLPDFTARRRQIADQYRKGILNKEIRLMAAPPHPDNHVHHLFVVTCRERDRLQKYLLDQGVETLIHYPIPVHKQKPCIALQRDVAGLGASEAHGSTCLSLPCHPFLKDHEITKVIDAVNAYQ